MMLLTNPVKSPLLDLLLHVTKCGNYLDVSLFLFRETGSRQLWKTQGTSQLRHLA